MGWKVILGRSLQEPQTPVAEVLEVTKNKNPQSTSG